MNFHFILFKWGLMKIKKNNNHLSFLYFYEIRVPSTILKFLSIYKTNIPTYVYNVHTNIKFS